MGPIVIVDYHKGNLRSVARGIADAGAEAIVSDSPADIRRASGVVMPGVGSFADAMDFMEGSGQADALRELLPGGLPFLGICLGQQVLFDRGDEGAGEGREWVAGLGLLRGSCTRLESSRLKVPHVGWDQVDLTPAAPSCPLLEGVVDGHTMYFTHSYATADDIDPSIVMARTHYVRSFASIVWHENLYGCQFHPEKSSGNGRTIMENFVRIVEGASA